MVRSLPVRLNPQTVSWAVSFAFLEVGVASGLVFFGAGGLALVWAVLAAGVFAAFEHGLFAWLWAAVVARDEEEPSQEKSAIVSTPEFLASDKAAARGEEAPSPSFKVDSRLLYEEEVARLIGSRSSGPHRVIEVSVAIALACLALLGSHWASGRKPPTDQTALVDQLRSDLKECQEKSCVDIGGSGNDASHPDPKFRQELLDAVKNAANPPDRSWTGSSILGISVLVLLLIATAVSVVLIIRKRPETAAPLGTLGLVATAIKEAEHLSRVDLTSYRIAEIAFVILLLVFAGLAVLKILNPASPHPGAPEDDDREKSKVESPLSLLFSALVLLWALLAICYRQESLPLVPTPTSTPAKATLDYRVLPSIPGFVSGRTDQLMSGKSLDDVARETVQEARNLDARPDDLLLLLGSADCTAVRKRGDLSNKALALDRAKVLARKIEGMKVFSPNHVDAESLHQMERCTGSEDLRAVFPVLIEGEKAGARTH